MGYAGEGVIREGEIEREKKRKRDSLRGRNQSGNEYYGSNGASVSPV